MSDKVLDIQHAIEQLVADSYRRGYADALSGKPPEYGPATRAPNSDGMTPVPRRGRLPTTTVNEWITSAVTPEWRPVPAIVDDIRKTHHVEPGVETIRAGLKRMARAGLIVQHRAKPLFKAKSA